MNTLPKKPPAPVLTRATRLLGVALVLVLLTTPLARAQKADPLPWTGEVGITETVDQIMARDGQFPAPEIPQTTGKPQRINTNRLLLPQNPDSPQLAAFPPLPVGQSPVQEGGYSARSPQALGTSFTGVVLSEAGFIPPDTMGDVSPTQILFQVNGRVKLFDKAGVLGALNTTANTLFNSVRNASGVSDPIVRYDRITDRWFIIAINVTTPNRLLLAVSSPGPITGAASFTFFQFTQDAVGTTPNADTGNFADYCTLGVDANALYIGCRMFTTTAFYNTTAWVVRKSSMTSGGPIVVTAFRGLLSGGAGPDGPRGVNNDDSTATQGYFIGADASTFGRLVLRRISNPGTTPTISGNINLTVPTTTIPINVPAQGSTTALESVDDRLFAAAIRKNRVTGASTLWTAHAIQVNTSGVASNSGGRDAMRWYQIQNFGATPSLVQSGTLFDSAASTPRYYWMGSVNMSGQGHAAVGASFAATDEFVGAATAGRLSGDTLGTLQAPTVIVTGAGAYNQIAGGRNRWGDYSHTAVDPADDMTIWTFQEFCNAANSWAVRATKLMAPPPATPTSCSPSTVASGATNVNVTLTGAVVSGSGFFDPGPGFPNHISSSISGGDVTVNSTTWVSATQATLNISVGALAAPTARTITVTNPDGQAMSSATGILTITNPCTPASITLNPATQTIPVGQPVTFTAAASGSSPITFAWRRNGIPVVNGGSISGATTDTLTINPVAVANAGSYDVLVSNGCGSVPSTSATLTVTSPCGSPDFDGDGDAGTDLDIEAFFACLGGDCCATCGSPDFDGDGDAGTDLDIEAFVRVLGGGAC